MAYFLGRDVKVAITAEDDTHGFATSSNITQSVVTGSADSRVKGRTGTPLATAGQPLADVTGLDVTMGAVDEDIAFYGQRTALKAEIKKETTVSITLKKKDNFWSSMWAQGFRWGTNDLNEHTGLVNVVAGTDKATWGYRIGIMGKTSEEVITIAGCTMSNYTQTLNADGVTEETIEFMSHVTPLVKEGVSEMDLTALGSSPFANL